MCYCRDKNIEFTDKKKGQNETKNKKYKEILGPSLYFHRLFLF